MKRQFINNWIRICVVMVIATVSFTACKDDDEKVIRSSAKSITAFVFDELSPAVTANISGTSITATVPTGTDLTSLAPDIELSAGATVSPASNAARDFSSPVQYTVTAADGSTQVYTVTVSVNESSAKDISAFVFAGLDPEVEATIDGTNIMATVPFGADLTTLAPTITVSPEATVDPASGAVQDFTEPVVYTVTAEDGTTKEYTVTIMSEVATTMMVSPVVEFTEAKGAVPAYFNADNNESEIAVDDNYIYVHSNNDRIIVHDITTGAIVDTINAKEITVGMENLFLGAIDTDDNGIILGTPFMSGPEKRFPIYRWDDKDAAQEIFIDYTKPFGYSIGRNITVVGDLNGDATIYLPMDGSTANMVLKFVVTGGVASNTPELITIPDVVFGNVVDVAPVSNDVDADFWVAGTSLTPTLVSQDGAIIDSIAFGLPTNDAFLNMDYFEVGGHKVLVVLDLDYNGPASPQQLVFIDVTGDPSEITEDHIISVDFSVSDTAVNFNGTGGIDVVVDEAAGTATVFGLITNLGVGVYTVSFEE